jgi:hypothetical protein
MTEVSWKRILGWFWEFEEPPRALPAPVDPEPTVLRSQDETWLEALADDAADGRRVDEIGSDEFWGHIEQLWKQGHERMASQWIEKFIAMPSTPEVAILALRLRLVEMCDQRGDLSVAVSHLEVLTVHADHAVRANYLLGEHHRRLGDEQRAMRHYEAVLARDVGYPNVRARLDRLRAARGEAAPNALDETMAGPELAGATGARYLLVRELGRGATAVVYLARDTQLDRDVAVKLLHPHLAAAHRAGACARFFQEARVCASLRHPNIVAILDLDETARRIVMELAAGGTLRDALRLHGRRTLRRALERHAQILSALNSAHQRGIIHRDVKPGNLMYRRDPALPGTEIMLGDFGVAHLPDPDDRSSSGRSAAGRRDAVGTLGYMSPEQRRGEALSPRSDLYSAAVVLYEMLTGSLPWPQEVLLGGTRRRGDFRLPPDVIEGRHRGLCAALQEHLDLVGDPEVDNRPTSEQALEGALELRDWAIAEVS